MPRGEIATLMVPSFLGHLVAVGTPPPTPRSPPSGFSLPSEGGYAEWPGPPFFLNPNLSGLLFSLFPLVFNFFFSLAEEGRITSYRICCSLDSIGTFVTGTH